MICNCQDFRAHALAALVVSSPVEKIGCEDEPKEKEFEGFGGFTT